MSLLTEASLIVTPNAYNVGKLYSVIPNTTLGDMDVSRSSSATRVNSAGLIEIARTNLVLRSEEFDDAAWNKGTGGSISANSVISPSGISNADAYTWATSATTFAYLSQAVSAISQNSNTFSIWLKRPLGSGSRTIRLIISDVTISTANSSTFTVTEAWQRFEFTRTSVNTTGSVGVGLIFGASGTPIAAGEILDVWGAQLEQSSVATDYIPTTTSIRTKFAGITQDGGVAQNIPRIDYTGGGCPSILVEPARTNNVLYSEQFDNASWNVASNSTVTLNAGISPSGNNTANLITATSADGRRIQSVSLTAGTYTYSYFVKKGNQSSIQVLAYNSTLLSIAQTADFNLDSGTLTSGTGIIQQFINGWYRVSVTFTIVLTNTIFLYIKSGLNNNAIGSTVFAWGAQLEAGTTVTSYIPTTTVAVPRNADSIIKTGITNLIGQTEGTLYAEVIGTKEITANNKFICIIGGTKNIHIAFYSSIINVVSNPIDLSVSFTPNVNYKIAVRYLNTGNFRVYVNGVKTHEVNTYVGGTFNNLGIGNTIAGSSQVNSSINSVQLYKTALTDDQCILLTGPSFSSYPEMASALIYTLQ